MTRGLRRGAESLADWAQRHEPRSCQCGCGGCIQITTEHRRRGVPRFLPGHNAKTGFEQWAEEHRGKHVCECGCGEVFKPTRRHRELGFPRYLRGHALRVAHVVTANVTAWVQSEQNRHLCECGCGRAIPIWPTYYWSTIPRFRRECLLRHRVGEVHPCWVADRSKVTGGRRGQYFLPRVKRAVLARDGHRCRVCGSSQNLTIDHIVPVFENGPGTVDNGQTLCVDCHKKKSRVDRARYWERWNNSRRYGGIDADSGNAT